MNRLTINRTQEVTLAIQSPSLAASSPQKTSTAVTPASADGSMWTVTLTRQNDTLTVGVFWQRDSPTCENCGRVCTSSHHGVYSFGAMHLVPRKTPSVFTTVSLTLASLKTAGGVKGTIDVDKVLDDDKYCFDIVISSSNDLSRKAVEPPKACNLNRDTMSDLLKDINSVDTCFVFDTEKTTSNVGLWAHRVILSKYERFAQMILEAASFASPSKDASSALTDTLNNTHLFSAHETLSKSSSTSSTASTSTAVPSENPATLTVVIKKFSLATFCVLLRFIYTGDISLSADMSQHAISMTESSLVLQDIANGGKGQESIRWNPMDASSPWKFKDVTWEELLDAADYFGVTDLRTHCEKAVIKAMDESKAVAMLFRVGPCYEKTKESAMEFVVKNMTSMVKDGKEPFTLYKDHPDCYSIMFEVMRRRAVEGKDP